MIKIAIATLVVVCALASTINDQTPLLTPEDLNADLLKTINNYFGCKTWRDGVCVQCSTRYYFNNRGVCCEVKPQCKIFNQQVGICETCYTGYRIKDGVCVLADSVSPTDKGCRTWNGEICSQCSKRWYLGPNNVCYPVDDLCRTWDQTNGNCVSCYQGYVVENGKCVVDPQSQRPVTDLLCAEWKAGVCVRCSQRSYFSNGSCRQVSDNCQTWDNYNGNCLSCYKGYNLNDGSCVLSQQQGPTDKGCRVWDWENQKCTQCSNRWVFSKGVCIPVDDLCATYDVNGICLSCYFGYELVNGKCQYCELEAPQDLGCRVWEWKDQICRQCSLNWYYKEGVGCVPVDTSCKGSNEDGECTACYKGYELSNGACVLSAVSGPTDAGCASWDWDNQKCLKCSFRWTFNRDGVCTPVSQGCSSWGSYGECTACYKGYELSNGACVLSAVSGPTDAGCASWDWDNQKCLKCSFRWTFNRDGVCTPVNDGCSSWGSYGECTVCYKGYELSNGACVLSAVSGPTDAGCASWDWDNQKCLKCSFRWTFNRDGVCTPVSQGCSSWGSYGECTACYKGYELSNGACVLSAVSGPTDAGCASWDWDNQKCLKCSFRWTFNRDGVCTPVSQGCSSWGSYGECTACYKGYELSNGACVLSAVSGPTDAGCASWDWDNQKCLKCSFRWTFNRDGVCTPVSQGCSSWGSYGECTACYKGYELSNGACVLSAVSGPTDAGCASWDWDNQKCLKCSFRWTFNRDGVCTPVSQGCSSWGSYGECTACYKGYELSNGACVLSAVSGPTDAGCASWDWDNQKCLKCSFRWTFNRDGVCTPVNDGCSSWGSYGECTACYKGYELSNGACVLSAVSGPTDAGCASWDWDNQKCLKCSFRWTFNKDGVCTPVNDGCSSWGSYGECTACYKGYELSNGACVLSAVSGPTDAGCASWDWDNQKCLKCSFRWTFNRDGVCTPVNDGCSSWGSYGECTACYKGYELSNGACVLSAVSGPTDAGCASWDWDNQKCLKCSFRWTFNRDGVCTPVNDGCSSWGSYGECTACYKGYELSNGACVLSAVSGPTDAGCASWDWDNQKCLKCSFRWTFNRDGVCTPVSDGCSSWGSYGECTACYKGYELSNGACVLSAVSGPTDAGCASWDWDNQKCLKCSFRWTFNRDGVCTPVNDGCSSWGSYGECTACYKGYELSNGACVLSAVSGPTDAGCASWDWDNQKCLKCSFRWTFNRDGVCTPVSQGCSSWGSYGECTACYKGYELSNGACVLSAVSGPTDAGCASWDWDNQKCLKCSFRWTFNRDGVCTPVSQGCSSWGSYGECTACYKGYELSNGACVLSSVNQLCNTSSPDGSCLSCYTGYVLLRKQCVPISKLANLQQYYAQCCPQKLAALKGEKRLSY